MAAPDLERLIRIIVEEVAAAQTTAAPARCGCHAVLYECCPDRLRGVIEAGASRLGLHVFDCLNMGSSFLDAVLNPTS